MKRLFTTIMSILLINAVSYGGLITHTDYVSGAVITASGQNTNENTIFNEFNGNIDNSNIKGTASIAASKLAAMNTTTVVFTDGSGFLTTAVNSSSTNSSMTITGLINVGGIQAVTNGSVATAGNVGEFLSSTTANSNFAASTHYSDLVSTTVGAGDWIFNAMAQVDKNASSVTDTQIAITTLAGDNGGNFTKGLNSMDVNMNGSGATNWELVVPSYHVSVNTPTVYYFKIEASYSAGTPLVSGVLTAQRIR